MVGISEITRPTSDEQPIRVKEELVRPSVGRPRPPSVRCYLVRPTFSFFVAAAALQSRVELADTHGLYGVPDGGGGGVGGERRDSRRGEREREGRDREEERE